MIVKIICAGNDSFAKVYHHDDDEFLIGCDGGALVLIREHLPINLAIGDFDSSDFTKISNYADNIIKVSAIKDESDLELALNYVNNLQKDVTVQIYNATGKRLDHYQAIINCLIKFANLKIKVIDANNEISLTNSQIILKDEYSYVSFFAIDNDTIISLDGFLYPLKNKQLPLYDSLCLSNEIVGSSATLSTNKKILMIKSK